MVVSTVKMESNWGRVLRDFIYSNLPASLPLFFMALGEQEAIQNASTEALMVVMVSLVGFRHGHVHAWLAI